jgi:hypothetical protein
MDRTEATGTQQSETDRVKHTDGDIRQQLDEPIPIFGDLTIEDIGRQRHVERLLDCVKLIKKSQDKLNQIDEFQHSYELSAVDTIPIWMDGKGERGILRKQNMERRHRLLGRALANLLDVISSEVGNSAVDRTLYPEDYDSVELGRAGK